MKIQGLIHRLEQFKKKYGNVNISVYSPEEMDKGFITPEDAFICFHTDEKEKITDLVFVNRDFALDLDPM